MKASPDLADHPPRVLIVDDEVHNRRLLEVMLGQEGFELTTANSGEDALASIRRSPPDLILLDIMMPGMDGYQVAEGLKGSITTSNIPIIMVTALGDRDERLRGLNAGAEDFLTKPVDRVELRVRVRNLLRLKAYGDYHDQYSQRLEDEVGVRTADLVECKTRFRQLAETIDEVFFLIAVPITQFLYVSPAFDGLFGRNRHGVYANPQSWLDAVHPDDRRRVIQEITPNGALVPFDLEYRIVRPDGGERAIRSRAFPIYNEAGEIYRFAGLVEDITERRTLEAQVRQAGKMDAIGRLAAGVAHDFNNLLTVILGFAELVASDDNIAARHAADLSEILKAAQRASGLTKQLLAFSRQQVLHAAPIDVNGLITEMATMLRRLIGEQIQVVLAPASGLQLALADRGQVEQVVMNLVVNARDAMPDGGIVTIETADVDLENSVFHEEAVISGPYVMISVTDTGTGMTDETRRRLFEPFFTTKESGKGTGLGLSTTYGIVKQSKGYIWVYSELGHGATFKVYFPCAPKAAPEDAAAAPGPEIPAIPRAVSETVLLVEDESGVRQLSKRILSSAGYRVLEASNGDEAERVFVEYEDAIALVVTDVIMPGCGGPELVNRLRGLAPSLRVLYMSGYSERTAASRVGVPEGAAFIQKPFTAAELARHVRDALDR